MTGERDEVRTDFLHVEREMRRRLGGIDDRQGTDFSGPSNDPLDRVDRAERVGLVHERDDFGSVGDDLVDGGLDQPALVVDRDPAERGPGSLGQKLPRHEVGVVLHLGDDDLVARTDPEPLRRREGGRVRERVRDAG